MDLPATNPGKAQDLDRLFHTAPSTGSTVLSDNLAAKRVLITGAGGSIGFALARSVWASAPDSLVLLDTSENGLYQIDRGLREAGCHRHISILGSVCDERLLADLFEHHCPQIVFHAAALKQVPLMEHNPFAAIINNSVGTLSLSKIAVANRAESLILVSTDKAADPLSMMGASKRIAELAVLAIGQTTNTRMIAIRLGNVVGSQGSVLPLFQDQIARGGPVTVTHPEAKRYFLSIGRTVEALFAALELPKSPVLVVPDMGEQVRILHLARYLQELHGGDVDIELTALRTGDKLTESLIASRESWLIANGTGHTGLREIATPVPAFAFVDAAMQQLHGTALRRDLRAMLQSIAVLVPEYQPSAVLIDALGQAASTAPEPARAAIA